MLKLRQAHFISSFFFNPSLYNIYCQQKSFKKILQNIENKI